MTEHVFPPAIVPLLRDRLASRGTSIDAVSDHVLDQMLTVVFFAGLETHEGDRNPIRIVFAGASGKELLLPEAPSAGAPPVYRWRMVRFHPPRPFSVPELVKLAVVTTDERMYTQVCLVDGQLLVGGLAREGTSGDADPFVKIVAARPGALSIRNGRDRIVEYERGNILTGSENIVFTAGPVRRALEAAARSAGLEDTAFPGYVSAVRALVSEMSSHGRGGVLVVSAEEHPEVPDATPYLTETHTSLATLLRISTRLADRAHAHTAADGYGGLMRSAYLDEIERTIVDLGALTAIDGATVLNRDLALVGFGSALSVVTQCGVVEATDPEGTNATPYDLGKHGTRHRAAVAYACAHIGAVVFIASTDGPIKCMLREPSQEHVTMWQLGSDELRR